MITEKRLAGLTEEYDWLIEKIESNEEEELSDILTELLCAVRLHITNINRLLDYVNPDKEDADAKPESVEDKGSFDLDKILDGLKEYIKEAAGANVKVTVIKGCKTAD